MRSTRFAAALVAVLAIASCSDSVATPTEITMPPAFARASAGANVMPRQEITVPIDNAIFVACAGEDVRFTGETVFWLTQVSTPAGVEVLHVTIPASEATITATGESSGTVWTLERGASVQTIVRKDGEAKVVSVSRNEQYVAGDGSTLQLHHNLQIVTRDGEPVRVEMEEWTCR